MVNKQNKYWADREAAERGWQAQQEKNLEAHNKHLVEMYQNAIEEINKEIKKEKAENIKNAQEAAGSLPDFMKQPEDDGDDDGQ